MLIESQETRVPAFIRDLAQRISHQKLAQEVGVSEETLSQWIGRKQFSPSEIWRLFRSAYKYGFFDVLPAHGMPPVSYNITAPFDITAPPLGYDQEPPQLSLHTRETWIAGHPVDFPLGLPASVLAANAHCIKFYASRGFDILTYKTVRIRYRQEHPWPNWVFLENAPQIENPSAPPMFIGEPGYWPEDPTKASMANSFGVPSLDPTWWKEDIRKAREFVREGHQVLIVSIVASVVSSIDDIAADFAQVALLAKDAGADIVEANYSCPNTPGDPAGEIYQSPEKAARISAAIREALGNTSFLTKIGYLAKPQLQRFLELNAKYIDGVVAINTVAAEVIQRPKKVGTAQKVVDYLKALNYLEKNPTFPSRPKAGVSGWAIKARAQEVARNLVDLRKEIPGRSGKPLAILGVGGVLTAQDFFERLAVGVYAVESCTGAFLNPYLGLEIRSYNRNVEQTDVESPAR